MSIVVVGSMALDTITTPYGQAGNVLGGSATYFAMAASYFGKIKMLSTVGRDFPDRYMVLLQKRGIDIQGIHSDSGETFSWTGSYDDSMGEATTLHVAANVLADYSPKVPPSYRKPGILFLANIDPSVQMKVVKSISPQKLIVMDTMNLWIDTKRKDLLRVIKKIHIIILNDAEARQLTGQNNLHSAARTILAWGPKRVVIKKGEHGAIMFSAKGIFMMPAFIQERLIDTTGAGDSFAGGFLGYLGYLDSLSGSRKRKYNENDYRKALVYGNVMASFTVEDFSVRRLNSVSKKEIRDRYRVIRRLVSIGV